MSATSIEIIIGEKTFKLKVSEDQRELILKAVDEINKKMDEFTLNYKMTDKYDILVMSALQLVTLKIAMEESLENNNKIVLDKLKKMNDLLDLT
ncbi:MAG: hypothetical protein A2X12_00510 [Bacteroidetes bacterium GWE2_29_8]|nr:MAG: hypothetical protein A2X12_00510 [Bacteroidetes bacterium GWE2_29_8]OFY19640.1 MAG: hypothetical protein A2X02_09605 [Bacteroidetes bacterium GWF2_29_10]